MDDSYALLCREGVGVLNAPYLWLQQRAETLGTFVLVVAEFSPKIDVDLRWCDCVHGVIRTWCVISQRSPARKWMKVHGVLMSLARNIIGALFVFCSCAGADNRSHTSRSPHIRPLGMATLVGTDQASLLDDRINILDRNAADATPIQQVFSAVSGILVLVRVSTLALHPSWNGVSDHELIRTRWLPTKTLSNFPTTVSTYARSSRPRSREGARVALAKQRRQHSRIWEGTPFTLCLSASHSNGDSRIMWKVEQVLAGRAEASMPHAEYDKDEIEGYKMEIQQILHTLDAPSPSLSKEDSVDEPACTESSLVDSATTSVSQNGTQPLASPSPILYGILIFT